MQVKVTSFIQNCVFDIYTKLVHCEHKQTVSIVFITSNFVLNIFSIMLSSFELCQQKQGLCRVYIREISECYICMLHVHITQDLEFAH
jgi:hypothetical protein